MTLWIINLIWLSIVFQILFNIKRQNHLPHRYQSLKEKDRIYNRWSSRYQLDVLYGLSSEKWQFEIFFQLYICYLAIGYAFMIFIITSPVYMIIAGLILTFLPIFILEIQIERVVQSIDKDYLNFLQAVHASILDTEDIIVALKKAEKLIDNKYLKRMLVQFNSSIKIGLNPTIAFEILINSSQHTYLKYTLINLEQLFERRGSVDNLISDLEHEYTSVQIELNKRRIELKRERRMVVFILVLTVGICRKVLTDYNYIWSFYVQRGWDTMVYLIIGLAIFLTIFVLIRSARLKY